MVFFCPLKAEAKAPAQHASRRKTRKTMPEGDPIRAMALSAPLGGEIRCRKTVAELGMTNLAITRGFDHGPSVGVRKQRLEHQRVQPVAAALRVIGSQDRRAGKRKVADRVKRLVAHELVGETQTFAVDDAVVADCDGVFERGAERKAGGPQALHILHEAEGARARQFAAEGARVHVDLDLLIADQRRVEIDLDIEVETVVRSKLTIGTGVFHRDLLQDLEVAARRLELGKTDLIDRLDEA